MTYGNSPLGCTSVQRGGRSAKVFFHWAIGGSRCAVRLGLEDGTQDFRVTLNIAWGVMPLRGFPGRVPHHAADHQRWTPASRSRSPQDRRRSCADAYFSRLPGLTSASSTTTSAAYPIRLMTLPTHSASGRWCRTPRAYVTCHDFGTKTHPVLRSGGVSNRSASNPGSSAISSSELFFCMAAGIPREG